MDEKSHSLQTMTTLEAKRVPVRFGICVVSLFLAGCVRSGESPIRIVTVGGVTEFFPLFLAQELGHFRDEHVIISLDEAASGSKALQAVLGGSADIVYNTYMQTL